VRAAPETYELHFEDETHLETNPYLGRIWHRVGQQPVLAAAGTNRRLTVFGSVETQGAGAGRGAGGAGRGTLRVRRDSCGTWRRSMPATRRPSGG
jgi:hypothetical protein